MSAEQKAFLSDPGTILQPLEDTTISTLEISENRRPSFLRRMERKKKEDIKQARMTLEGHDYLVILGENPSDEFSLYDLEKQEAPMWWGSWSLASKHPVNGKLYEFITVENDTKIASRPYRGDMGVFKVGAGGRDLQKIEFQGSLMDISGGSVLLGDLGDNRWPKPVTAFSVPVGDYTALLVDITYDTLHFEISNNYHTNAEGQKSGPDRKTVYGISVRKDQPYVLDFSTQPVVIFDQPSQEQTIFYRGDEIKFAAVLVDPKLDVMIRSLEDTSIQVDKEYTYSDGSTHTVKENKSLKPAVVIARANGEIVAEGVMPFG